MPNHHTLRRCDAHGAVQRGEGARILPFGARAVVC